MLCPLDKNQMKEMRVYDMQVDICSVCFGVWFDMYELKKVVEKMSFGLIDPILTGKEDINPKEEKQFFWQEDILECPRDYTKMFKNNFAGNSKIHIDKCTKCEGVWVDGYEIKRIQNDAMPNPTLDTLGMVRKNGSCENAKLFASLTQAK